MSTYTDLHNNIKETVNVDYHTRATNQQVKLLNEQNEYWGTFKGQMEVEGNSVISGAQLHDVIINNATLCGVIAGGIDIPVDKITSSLQHLQTEFNEKSEQIDNVVADVGSLQTNVDSICSLVSGGSTAQIKKDLTDKIAATSADVICTVSMTSAYLENHITSVFVDLEKHINNVNDLILSNLSAETSARVSADEAINGTLNEHDSKINDLHSSCDEIHTLALSVNDNSSRRYEDALQKLQAHADANDAQFREVQVTLLSTMLRDRHYETCSAEKYRQYPYQLHDYCVNTIKAITGNKLLKDSSGTYVANVDIKDDGNNVDVHFYSNLPKDSITYEAVQPGRDFSLLAGIDVNTSRNNYQIRYDKSEQTISLTHKKDEYCEIRDARDATLIGKIHDVSSYNDYSDVILSGVLDIYKPCTEFEPFNKFTSKVISKSDPVITIDGERIALDTDELSTLKFYTGVHTVKYMNVLDAAHEDAMSFAKIFETGIKLDESGMISSITVRLDKREVLLEKDNAFSADYATDDTSILYTLKLDDGMLAKYEKHAKHQYAVNDDDESGDVRGAIRIHEENTLYKSGFTSSMTYHIAADATTYEPFKNKDVLCTYDATSKTWHGKLEDASDEKNFIEITIDMPWWQVRVKGKVDGGDFSATYKVSKDVTIYNEDDAFKLLHKSGLLDFDAGFTEKDEDYSCVFDTYTHRLTSYALLGDETLSIVDSDASIVKCILPECEHTGISRELMLRLEVTSAEKTAKLKFIGPNDSAISVSVGDSLLEDNVLSVQCNRQLTYRVVETSHNQFIVEDVFNVALSAVLDEKFDAVNDAFNIVREDISSLQISATSCQISVSTALSNIDEINKQLSSTLQYQGMISADDSITSFYELLYNRYYSKTIASISVDCKLLYPGWFWIVNAGKKDHLSVEGVKVGHNDRIYINGTDPVAISALTSSRVDVEDVYDSDTVHEDLLSSISASLSSYTTTVSNALCETSCMLSADDKHLSSQISSKVSIGEYDADRSDYVMRHADLSVVTISDDIYYRFRDDGKLLSDVIYVISSDELNAHSDIIKNVKSPVASSDAANKAYVDDQVTSAMNMLSDYPMLSVISAMSADLSTSSDKTVSTISAVDGKLSVTWQQISIEQSAVIGLTDRLLTVEASAVQLSHDLYDKVSLDLDDLTLSTITAPDGLSVRLSALEHHYGKTFTQDATVKHHHEDDKSECDVLSIDRLNLVDEDTFHKTGTISSYQLAFLSGTLVLIKS